MKNYSVKNLNENVIELLAEIKSHERREYGAILEDCIILYWDDVFGDADDQSDE